MACGGWRRHWPLSPLRAFQWAQVAQVFVLVAVSMIVFLFVGGSTLLSSKLCESARPWDTLLTFESANRSHNRLSLRFICRRASIATFNRSGTVGFPPEGTRLLDLQITQIQRLKNCPRAVLTRPLATFPVALNARVIVES